MQNVHSLGTSHCLTACILVCTAKKSSHLFIIVETRAYHFQHHIYILVLDHVEALVMPKYHRMASHRQASNFDGWPSYSP